jgi:hypothetical protein
VAPDGSDGQLSDAPLPLTTRLERAFAAQMDGLPDNTRVVLLAAALDGRASLEELVRSASTLAGGPLGVSDLDPAVAAELVSVVDGRVRFRHPLVRSAVRQAAPPAQVLEMYGALAEVVADPERRTWHRAMAAVGYDEQVAAALDQHAVAARRRGAVMVAAAALERAAALTADPRRRGERWFVPRMLRTSSAPSTWSGACSNTPSRSTSANSKRPGWRGCSR